MGNCVVPPIEEELSLKDFRLSYRVGKGYYSDVWKALDLQKKKVVAVKQIDKGRVAEKGVEQGVRNELQALVSATHRSLPIVYAAFQDSKYLYLVTEYFSGGTLRSYLNKEGTLNESQGQALMRGLVDVVEYLHLNGYTHCDLKPENIVFDEQGYLRLVDFGCVQIGSPQEGRRLKPEGTFEYMSPEVLFSMRAGPERDLYAIGVILYECITGSLPWEASSLVEAREKCREVRELPKNSWSVEANEICRNLLAWNKAKRINSIKDLKTRTWVQGPVTPVIIPNNTDNYKRGNTRQPSKNSQEIRGYQYTRNLSR